MAIFGKKTPKTYIPELQEYYATKEKKNTIVSGLFVMLSLVVTIVVIIGLYSGGRWIVRKIRNTSNVATVTIKDDSNNQASGINTDLTNTSQPTPKSTSLVDTSKPTSSDPVVSITKPALDTPAQGVSTKQSDTVNQNATAASAVKPTTVPNTGPNDIILEFITIAVLGTLGHRFYLLKNLR